MALMKLCARCGKEIKYPARYCNQCLPIAASEEETMKAKRSARYNGNRDSKAGRFYHSKAWQTIKNRKLQLSGYRCSDCGAIASEVHHEKPLDTAEGWENRFNMDGLKCVCVRCHNARHGRFCRAPPGES